MSERTIGISRQPRLKRQRRVDFSPICRLLARTASIPGVIDIFLHANAFALCNLRIFSSGLTTHRCLDSERLPWKQHDLALNCLLASPRPERKLVIGASASASDRSAVAGQEIRMASSTKTSLQDSAPAKLRSLMLKRHLRTKVTNSLSSPEKIKKAHKSLCNYNPLLRCVAEV